MQRTLLQGCRAGSACLPLREPLELDRTGARLAALSLDLAPRQYLLLLQRIHVPLAFVQRQMWPIVPITREPKETNYRCVTRGFLSELVPGPS